MIQEEEPPFWKFNSEIHIDTNTELNISLQQKEHIQGNIFSVVDELPYLLVMYFQLIKLLRVQPFAIFNHLLEIKDLILDAQEHMQLLSGTLMMAQEQE